MRLGKEIPLKDNETIIRIVRRYGLTHIWSLFFAIFSIVFAFFTMFWLFHKGWIGIFFFAIFLGFGILTLLRVYIQRYRNVCYITSHRVVDVERRGLFHCVVSDVPYDQIEDVSGHVVGIFGTIFRYGDVRIQLSGGMVRIIVENIKQPVFIQRIINDMRERAFADRR